MHKIRIKDNIHANARNAVPIYRELLRNSDISYRSHWHRSLSSDRHHLLFYIICEKWPEHLVSRNEYIFFRYLSPCQSVYHIKRAQSIYANTKITDILFIYSINDSEFTIIWCIFGQSLFLSLFFSRSI